MKRILTAAPLITAASAAALGQGAGPNPPKMAAGVIETPRAQGNIRTLVLLEAAGFRDGPRVPPGAGWEPARAWARAGRRTILAPHDDALFNRY